MSKKIWKIVCVVSLVLSIFSAIPIISVILQQSSQPKMGIIGGADFPTYLFIMEKLLFRHPLFYIGLIFFALFLLSLVVLFAKRIRKR